MKLTKIVGVVLLLLAATEINLKAQSDSTLSFSLLEAQNYAIENYFLTINAQRDIESADKKIWETTAMGLPQISATGDYSYIPNAPTLDFGGTKIELMPEQNITYGARVNQLIFSGEYIVGLQAAKVYRTLSEENYEKAKIDLRENIASNYYGILVLEANEEVLLKTLENLKDNLYQTKKTYEAGLAEDVDVDQLQLTVKRTESDLASLTNQIRYMRRLFKYQLGLTEESTIVLTENLDDLINRNIISDENYKFVLEDNIEYNMLETNEELMHLDMNRYKSAYLPSISGFYSYSDQTSATDFSPTVNHMLGVSASWSLFESGQRSARVAQARIELEKAQTMKEQESERLRLSAQQARFDYQTALEKYQNEKLNFELSEKVLDKTNERFKQGMVSSLEQSIVNTQFLSAQLSFSTAIQELLTAKVALDKAYSKL